MDFNAVYQSYHDQLDEVEQILHARAQARELNLSRAGQQLIAAGGKRLRPLFALICGNVQQQSEVRSSVAKVAAALEMTHMATLVHDDVIDHADLRRGRPTVRSEFGNLAAMFTGDFLFAKAIQLLAELQDVEVNRRMSLGMARVCQGEVEQIRDFFNWDQSFRSYFRRIERKTALLISLSCSLGAKVSGANEESVRALRTFGHYTGMAFQIIDDVLDFTGTVKVVGKPVGGDLRQGNITLPALIAAREFDLEPQLRTLVHENMSETDAGRAIELIVQTDALKLARSIADRYLERALRVLRRVSDPRIQEELSVLTTFVAQRVF